MQDNKNINITLNQSSENDNNAAMSVSILISQLKKYFLAWLILSVVILMLVSGLVMMLKTSVKSNEITALVSFNYSGIESGKAPDGSALNVNKIKSPSIIETALTNIDMPLTYVESVRRNISIEGIIPSDALDKISLYQSVYIKGGTAGLSAVESLLNIGYYPSYYVVKLDYSNLKLTLIESKQILDNILKSYQEYFFTTYGYNKALGNAIVSVDYTDYDYSAAIDIFEQTLTSLDDYVSQLSSENYDFRSNNTGYSFGDLSKTINTIQSTDLDSISAYVSINNVTNDKKLLINYYKYRIDEYERDKNVYIDELESITKSIETYEKEKLLLFSDTSEIEGAGSSEYQKFSQEYDDLIVRKLNKQREVSRTTQRIDYFNDRMKDLKANKGSMTTENKEYVESKLAIIDEKISELINVVNDTADEYYETVTFAHAYNILVPATGIEPTVVTKDLLLPNLIAEAVIFLLYAGTAFVTTIMIDIKNKKEYKSDAEVEEVENEIV